MAVQDAAGVGGARGGVARRGVADGLLAAQRERGARDANPLDYDAWDGYQANRNRTLAVLYDGAIGDNVFLAGDSHAAWVSDVAWLGAREYDAASGAGAVGVEFAGSAVTSPSPLGANVSRATAEAAAQWLVAANPTLQWSELWFRGYYELAVGPAGVTATYFGVPDARERSACEVPLAAFDVAAGGVVGAGAVRGGTQRAAPAVCQHQQASNEAVPAAEARQSSVAVERGCAVLCAPTRHGTMAALALACPRVLESSRAGDGSPCPRRAGVGRVGCRLVGRAMPVGRAPAVNGLVD